MREETDYRNLKQLESIDKEDENWKYEKTLNVEINVLELFHHIHHIGENHEVHHCGGEHSKLFPKLNYKIKHCECNKHSIDKKKAIGHDLEMNEIVVEFFESCPEGGWHVESGMILENDK